MKTRGFIQQMILYWAIAFAAAVLTSFLWNWMHDSPAINWVISAVLATTISLALVFIKQRGP